MIDEHVPGFRNDWQVRLLIEALPERDGRRGSAEVGMVAL